MDWDGAVNAWHVAGGVYRMGRREWLTEAGWRQAYDDGVRTVVDLRNAAEARRRDTDPVVPAAALHGLAVVSAPTEEANHQQFAALTGPYLNDPAYYADNARLFPDRIVAVFRALADAADRGAVVLHCAAGRDRSGLVAAMVQDLAGDSDHQIAEGYRRAARGINERYRTHGPPHDRERYLADDELAPLLEQRGEAVVDFVRTLDSRGYLLKNGLSGGRTRRRAVPVWGGCGPMSPPSVRRYLSLGAVAGILVVVGLRGCAGMGRRRPGRSHGVPGGPRRRNTSAPEHRAPGCRRPPSTTPSSGTSDSPGSSSPRRASLVPRRQPRPPSCVTSPVTPASGWTTATWWSPDPVRSSSPKWQRWPGPFRTSPWRPRRPGVPTAARTSGGEAERGLTAGGQHRAALPGIRARRRPRRPAGSHGRGREVRYPHRGAERTRVGPTVRRGGG